MGAPPGKVWPKADIDYLTANYHVVNVNDIAKRFGKTKASVIGMAHRLGLSVTQEEINRRIKEGKGGMRVSRVRPRKKRTPQQFIKPPQPPAPPVVAPDGVTLLTLVPGQCKFPIGRKKVRIVDVKHDLTAFCGQPVDNGCPYCAAHMKVSYDRVRTRASTNASASYNHLLPTRY